MDDNAMLSASPRSYPHAQPDAISKMQVAAHFLLDLSDRLREIAAPRGVMTAAAELLGRHLGAMRVGYSEMEEDGVHLHIEGDWRAEGVASVAGRHNLES